ncbi:MAG: hypothetical protein RL736_11 [Pseudomonadota bacterium]|jgi:hypothetical protein
MSLNNSEVLKIVEEDLKDLDGKVVFVKGRYCGGKSKCSGLFYMDANDNPIIKVAKGGLKETEWFGVLIHEYAHFLQWRDDTKIWNNYCDYDITYSQILIKPDKYKKELLALMNLELDCEKRAYKIIKNNKLFDYKEYAQNANSILYKYAFLYNYNNWPDDNRKYRKVQKICPTKLLNNVKDYLDIPVDIVKIYG